MEKGFSKGKFPLDGSFSPAFLAVEKRGPVRRDGAKLPQAPLASSAGPGGAASYESAPRHRRLPVLRRGPSRLKKPPLGKRGGPNGFLIKLDARSGTRR